METDHCYKEEFLTICHEKIHRDGIRDLLGWLEHSDFFTAPASSRFHASFEGGLVAHSLNVYRCLLEVSKLFHDRIQATEESMAISALFHDLCKVNFYKQDFKNAKIDGQWTKVPFFSVEERFPFGGHGSKSVFLVERFMKLELDEAVAINCHMGNISEERSIANAYEKYPLAWALHVADEASTFLFETQGSVESADGIMEQTEVCANQEGDA